MVSDITWQDLLIAFPAYIVAAVAMLGLTAWRKQLRGREAYDLARKLLRAVLQYRDAVRKARSPITVFTAEEVAARNDKEQAQLNWGRRFEPITTARRELEALLLEAEVLWGSSYRTLADGLFRLESDLYVKVLEQVDSYASDADATVDTKDGTIERRRVLFARADGSDEFAKALLREVTAIEAHLRPRLHRPT